MFFFKVSYPPTESMMTNGFLINKRSLENYEFSHVKAVLACQTGVLWLASNHSMRVRRVASHWLLANQSNPSIGGWPLYVLFTSFLRTRNIYALEPKVWTIRFIRFRLVFFLYIPRSEDNLRRVLTSRFINYSSTCVDANTYYFTHKWYNLCLSPANQANLTNFNSVGRICGSTKKPNRR